MVEKRASRRHPLTRAVLAALLVVGAGCSTTIEASSNPPTSSVGVTTTTTVTVTEAPTTSVEAPTSTRAVPPVTRAPQPRPTDTCDVDHLAEAVIRSEGFDPRTTGLEPPGVLGIRCVDDWAVADIDRPEVGTTDGNTLFHWVGGTWSETGQVGWPPVDCRLVEMGVPTDAALQLSPADAESEREACADMGLPALR